MKKTILSAIFAVAVAATAAVGFYVGQNGGNAEMDGLTLANIEALADETAISWIAGEAEYSTYYKAISLAYDQNSGCSIYTYDVLCCPCGRNYCTFEGRKKDISCP